MSDWKHGRLSETWFRDYGGGLTAVVKPWDEDDPEPWVASVRRENRHLYSIYGRTRRQVMVLATRGIARVRAGREGEA